jgi:hypothetical protein
MNKLYIVIFFCFLSSVKGQSFKLTEPDLKKLVKLEKGSNHTKTIGYLYLLENYKAISAKFNSKFYEWDKKAICSFNQKFDFNIEYWYESCEEGKIHEHIIFPKLPTNEVKILINKLFTSKDNKWVSQYEYEPEEGGCFYKIKQEKSKTTIQIYCGC